MYQMDCSCLFWHLDAPYSFKKHKFISDSCLILALLLVMHIKHETKSQVAVSARIDRVELSQSQHRLTLADTFLEFQ